jgi:hypothetical protein
MKSSNGRKGHTVRQPFLKLVKKTQPNDNNLEEITVGPSAVPVIIIFLLCLMALITGADLSKLIAVATKMLSGIPF